jgi:thiol:disulfide interchange protein
MRENRGCQSCFAPNHLWQRTKPDREENIVTLKQIFRRATKTIALTLALTFSATLAIAQGPTAKVIYPTIEAAPTDVRAGLALARRTHRRLLLDFGGDWCPDCQVLDIYAKEAPNAQLLKKYFVKVNVNIGREDANLELAHKYGVPVTGVPALAVVDGYGKVLYSQTKEFSDMRNMKSSDLTDFLNKWKK